MPTIATPYLLRNPGFLFHAPLGTTLPTHTVTAGKFDTEWPAAWVGLGATEEGSEFTNDMSVEAISVAELFDPVAYEVTEQSSSLAFALASWTLKNLQRALNGGALSLVSGTGLTALNRLSPPDPSEITRCMIGWESLDRTIRLVGYQCLNGGTVSSAFRRAPDKALIPFELNFERPVSNKRWDIWSAGTDRLGV
jgi:hypothetical protein